MHNIQYAHKDWLLNMHLKPLIKIYLQPNFIPQTSDIPHILQHKLRVSDKQ